MEHAEKTKKRKLAERLVTAVTVVAACVALTAGGTLAYFSASETAHNVITSGGVEIELHEWANEARTERFADVEGVMPGDAVTKIVEVENVGASDAWVRIWIGADFTNEALDPGVLGIDTLEGWSQGADGWWYYGQRLAAGDTTTPLFEKVSFASGMGNAYQGGEAVVSVLVQAVQSDNNGSSAPEAAGWPKVEN